MVVKTNCIMIIYYETEALGILLGVYLSVKVEKHL